MGHLGEWVDSRIDVMNADVMWRFPRVQRLVEEIRG
jgi:hypothetical protein